MTDYIPPPTGGFAKPLTNWFAGQQKFTHAAIVIVSGAILDEALKEAIAAKIGPFREGTQDRVFRGPLGASQGRATMAFALNIIDQAMCNTLADYREVRNLFAHSQFLIDFDNPTVEVALKKLGYISGHKLDWWMKKMAETVKAIERHKVQITTSADQSSRSTESPK
jgi:hypothetical protein